MDVPESIQAAAEWFGAHQSEFWTARRLLLDYCAEHGPITLADGRRVGMFTDGSAWDADAVAEVVPALISRVAVTFEGSQEEAERALSLVTEEIPAMEFAVKRTVDRAAANGMLRVPGETAERLRACRLDKSKLSIR